MHIILAYISLALANPAAAQPAADAKLGYVVRADSKSVVLDFNEKSGASLGQGFSIFKEGEELKHPVTGQSLGKMEVKVAEGSLREILPMYSVGVLAAVSGPVAPGMRARLQTPVPVPQSAAAPAEPGAAPGRTPRWRSPGFDYQATAMAIGDVNGDGRPELALSDGKNVYVYPYPPQDTKPLAQFQHAGTAPRLLALTAADLNGNGRAELFVSLHNGSLNRFETLILESDGGAGLAKTAEITSLVRSYQDAKGEYRVAAQQITEDGSFPFGAIYPLQYKDGKYVTGRPALDFGKRRVDWLYDFTFITLDGSPATVSETSTELLRVQFPKGLSWKTPESYGQTPNRVRWTGDRMLNFRPQMPVSYDAAGALSGLYLIKNIAALGGLASPFGIFTRSELHRKTWNGVSLDSAWVGAMGGFSAGLALVPASAGGQEIAVAVVGTAGKTSIWVYDP